jgi:hypothetical protein
MKDFSDDQFFVNFDINPVEDDWWNSQDWDGDLGYKAFILIC